MNRLGDCLVLRVDANSQIGMGHMMRCFALAQAWQDGGGIATFVTAGPTTAMVVRLYSDGFEVQELAESWPGSGGDAAQTASTAAALGAEWVVVDGYHFDAHYQRELRRAGQKVLCIDDYGHLPEYDVDILLNQNIHAHDVNYRCNTDARVLKGLQYVMLRRGFRCRPAQAKRHLAVAQNVLVTMGGSDPAHAAPKVLGVLEKLQELGLVFKVIAGSANLHLDELFDAAGRLDRCEVIVASDDMRSLMEWADIAVTAGGSTCWELLFMGVPFLVTVAAENQIGIAKGLHDAGAAVNLREWGSPDSEIRPELEKLIQDSTRRSTMSAEGRRMVDGRGAQRVCSCIGDAR